MRTDNAAVFNLTIAIAPPSNGIVEVAGPEVFRPDELIRKALRAYHDLREVIADPRARYFGSELSECSLIPDGGA